MENYLNKKKIFVVILKYTCAYIMKHSSVYHVERYGGK